MRNALAIVGLGALIIGAGLWLAAHQGFTNAPDTVTMSSTSSSASMNKSEFSLTSSAFAAGSAIPSPFTCDGENKSPSLSWAGVPEGARSLTLIMDDPDVPKQLKPDGVFDHWVLFNIPPSTTELAAGGTAGMPGGNGAGKNGYTGPCPPAQYEPSMHRYVFRLYALDTDLPLQEGASKSDVLKAMQGHVLGQAELIGMYKRK
ncbi:MAG: hypothetical protein RLZZ416_156 [Candidatus Parcubacteria bacterium]|jgi:Raf kinase inhibitor-like YbhB/YbcL family protein